MKMNFTKFLMIALACLWANHVSAQQVYQYDFRNTFNETGGAGPAINALGTGTFINESLTDLSCLERPVYSFTQNSGIQFDNTAAGNFIGTSYTIEMYFNFDDNTGFMRIIDFKNRTSDFGLYATSSILQFYDELTVNTTAFGADQYVHLVISRDGGSEEVKMYINGVLLGSFTDSGGEALMDGSNVLNFFRDDLVFGGEARPGAIALMKIYDYVLNDTEVSDNFQALEATSGTVAFIPDVSSGCLNGNVFNFTNQSANAGAVTYTWEFGDGNTTTGLNASHSYSTDGMFDVLLIADNGAGCTDTATVTVEVLAAPAVDLGLDLDVCDGEILLLDAGSGFSSYLWNDGSSGMTLSVNTGGIYWVEVTDAMGCTARDSITVTYIPNPVFSLGSDTTLCFGGSIDLFAPPGMVSYDWSTGETTESINVNMSGVYAVEITSMDGCVASDTIEVTINPELIISLGNDTTICDGEIVTLDPGSGFNDYQWSDGSNFQTLGVTATGFYWVTVTDVFGCTASDFIQITVNSLPVVNLGNDTSVCGGMTMTLDAGAGFSSYLWTDGSSLQTLDITMGGTYAVTVTDGSGCTGTDEIIITTDPFVTLGSDIMSCDGQSVTLDPGAGFSSYLWSDGSSAQTLDVTVTGIYTVTVTDINGCMNFDEINVTFIPAPVVDLGTDLDVCDGDTVLLDAGGGFTTYLWSDGSSSQTLTVVVSGVYTVTVTDQAGCTVTDDITINVNPVPLVELGPPQNICSGTATVLDAGSGATTYLWSDGSTGQLLLVFASGTYTVTVTNSFGCEATDDVTVTVLNAPVVTLGADTTLCDGDIITLDAGAGFSAYFWSTGETTQTINTGTSPALYTVTVTDSNGCTGTDNIEIDFFAPVPTPSISQVGNTLVSSASTGNQWYANPGGIIPGATGNTYDPPADGLYYVVVTDINGCLSDPSPDFNFILSGIESVLSLSFAVYPNPADDYTTISFSGYPGLITEVALIDLAGRKVHVQGQFTGSLFRMNLSGIKPGTYFIRVSTAELESVRRLIISR